MATVSADTEQRNFAAKVVKAVFWRSGSQVVAQLMMWISTFFVIRVLDPADYGLFAMTQTVLVLFSLLNGHGFATALVRAERLNGEEVRQVFGLVLLLNGGVALLQVGIAPLAALYYEQPQIAALLIAQAALYLANPFIVVPAALLARDMDFSKQAAVNIVSGTAGALTAVSCALAGFGVWTLVAAPMVMAWTRAVGMTIAARFWMRPSFKLRGAGANLRFGGAMMLSTCLWLIQVQADVVIGGRALDAHRLGLYTTALFLAQIITAKFVPPLNEVAFTAYARLQNDRTSSGRAFDKSTRIIMLVALPFYIGLAVTADPFVGTVLGEKWTEAAPLVRILALAMPFMTLSILFTPATTALGQPRVQVLSAAAGALIMPSAFLIGVEHGAIGLAWAWLAAAPLLMVIIATLAMPVIGTCPQRLFRANAPLLIAAGVMGGVVMTVDALTGLTSPLYRLTLLVGVGAATYAALIGIVARPILREAATLLRRRDS